MKIIIEIIEQKKTGLIEVHAERVEQLCTNAELYWSNFMMEGIKFMIPKIAECSHGEVIAQHTGDLTRQ